MHHSLWQNHGFREQFKIMILMSITNELFISNRLAVSHFSSDLPIIHYGLWNVMIIFDKSTVQFVYRTHPE